LREGADGDVALNGMSSEVISILEPCSGRSVASRLKSTAFYAKDLLKTNKGAQASCLGAKKRKPTVVVEAYAVTR
jgi:hypothetical protein